MDFPICRCSNCDPLGAIELIHGLKTTNKNDFHALLSRPTSRGQLPETSFLNQVPILKSRPKERQNRPSVCLQSNPIRVSAPMIKLASSLINGFEKLFYRYHLHESDLIPSDLFTPEHAWQMVKNYTGILEGKHLRGIMGSQPVEGTFDMIHHSIIVWKTSEHYLEHLEENRKLEDSAKQAYEAGAVILAAYEEDQRLKEETKKKKRERVENAKRLRAEKVSKEKSLIHQDKRKSIETLEQISKNVPMVKKKRTPRMSIHLCIHQGLCLIVVCDRFRSPEGRSPAKSSRRFVPIFFLKDLLKSFDAV